MRKSLFTRKNCNKFEHKNQFTDNWKLAFILLQQFRLKKLKKLCLINVLKNLAT